MVLGNRLRDGKMELRGHQGETFVTSHWAAFFLSTHYPYVVIVPCLSSKCVAFNSQFDSASQHLSLFSSLHKHLYLYSFHYFICVCFIRCDSHSFFVPVVVMGHICYL